MLDTTPGTAVTQVLTDLNAALAKADPAAAAALFETDGYWRDLASLTWNLKTMEGQAEIAAMLAAQLAQIKPRGFIITPGELAEDAGSFQQAWIDFETETGRGHGHIRIRDGKIWTLLTTLKELKGHEERKGTTRPMGAEHGVEQGRKSWAETRAEETAQLGYDTQPEVLIIGGGQGGIALGARLRQLGVPTIIIEKNERPGDSWRKRYKSLCLHDPVWYDHLPYIPFPANWPVFAPKDKIGDWLEMYTRVMELNYWSSTTATSAKYDEVKKEWEVHVIRDGMMWCCARNSWCWPPACRPRRTGPSFRDRTSSRANSSIPAPIPAPMPTRARRWSSSAPTTPRMTSARRCGKRARM